MAEAAAPHTALAATPALPPSSTLLRDGSTLTVLPPRALVRVQLPRSRAADAPAVRIRDVALPTEPGRSVGVDPAVLWLAPDGWLVVAETADGTTLAREIRQASAGRTIAAVDVSDALVSLELAGPGTRALLARSTGLELSDATLAPGRCMRTRFAQLAVILRPRARDRVELLVDRGPARWLCDWLVDAASLLC